MCCPSVFRLLFSLGCFLAFFSTAEGTTRGKVAGVGRDRRQSGTGPGPESVVRDISVNDDTYHGDNEYKLDLSDQETPDNTKEDWLRRLERYK